MSNCLLFSNRVIYWQILYSYFENGKSGTSYFITTSANIWNSNKQEYFSTQVDLKNAQLEATNISGAYLQEANLSGANLSRANLNHANLNRANLSEANLEQASLNRACLLQGNLKRAFLFQTDIAILSEL